jgi:hypothetical protein
MDNTYSPAQTCRLAIPAERLLLLHLTAPAPDQLSQVKHGRRDVRRTSLSARRLVAVQVDSFI